MNKAGTNAGLGQWCTKLLSRAGIQARLLGIVYLPAVPAFSTKLTICSRWMLYLFGRLEVFVSNSYLGQSGTQTLVQACHFVRPGYNTCPLG